MLVNICTAYTGRITIIMDLVETEEIDEPETEDFEANGEFFPKQRFPGRASDTPSS